MIESTLAVSDAILFILDPSNRETIVPQYDPKCIWASTSSCVSIATRASVDGDITVQICQLPNGEHANGLFDVFDGFIETPGRLLAIVTSQFERIMEINVPVTKSRITIAVNDLEFPSLVSVNAHSCLPATMELKLREP